MEKERASFRYELWEADEYVISGPGGMLPMTHSKGAAQEIVRFLNNLTPSGMESFVASLRKAQNPLHVIRKRPRFSEIAEDDIEVELSEMKAPQSVRNLAEQHDLQKAEEKNAEPLDSGGGEG